MGKKVLGIDVDGTLANTVGPWCELARDRLNLSASKEDITDYSMSRIFNRKSSEIESLFQEVWKNYKGISLEHPGIPLIVKRLRRDFEVHIVTATIAHGAELRAWLGIQGIEFDKIDHFGRQRDKISSGADTHIDDSVFVSEIFAEDGRTAILLEQPWNRRKRLASQSIIRARNWRQIEGILAH